MKNVSNTKLIRKNKKIGQTLTLAALLVLGLGLYYSFAKPEMVMITFGSLLLGFIMTQVGIYYGNKWGKSPRPDEILTASLKGLEEKYTFYNYVTGISHTLIGPAGIFALIPVNVPGKITFNEKRKRFFQKGGNFYLKIFGQESIGRPEVDARYSIDDLNKYLKKNFPEIEAPEAQAIIVFTNPKVELEIENAPYPTVTAEKLKDLIRRMQKEKSVPLTTIQIIQKSLPTEDLK